MLSYTEVVAAGGAISVAAAGPLAGKSDEMLLLKLRPETN